MQYRRRLIDKYLEEWARNDVHKPVLLRGARQVGKSTAVRHLGEKFSNYVEINFEKQPEYKALFHDNLDVKRIVPLIEAMCGNPIKEGTTLLFLDEIQACQEAIMSLRFFKEDLPGLHVIAAGSLLEFALEELPTFGVGRIHSVFMYAMTFDEFLEANGEILLMEARNRCSANSPLSKPLHDRLVQLLRVYILVGGMPEVVDKWVETKDFLKCQEIQDDLVTSYEDDFPKYRKKVSPELLRSVMRSAAVQATQKFVYSQVGDNHKTKEIKQAVDMLILAGILIPVTHTEANGLPLGSEEDGTYRKMMLLDTGIMLRLLNLSIGNVVQITKDILTASETELVNKGPMAEMVAGLELLRYQSPNIRHKMFYWTRQAKNSIAEIDYVTGYISNILPIEVKAETQGGMKSLWIFMREKKIHDAIRCSLENFGEFNYTDKLADNAVRHVTICPLYAISRLGMMMNDE